jgi:hypothetical protein
VNLLCGKRYIICCWPKPEESVVWVFAIVGSEMSTINRLFLNLARQKQTSKDGVIKAIMQTSSDDRKYRGLRRGWQVKAASWVKKTHVDRGDKKVGLRSLSGSFHIIEDLRPRYIVPDEIHSTKLRPYVSHYKLADKPPENKNS